MEPFYKEKKRILQFNNKVSQRMEKSFSKVIFVALFPCATIWLNDRWLQDFLMLSLKSFFKASTIEFT